MSTDGKERISKMKYIDIKTCAGNRKSISVRSNDSQKKIESKYLGSSININGNKETVMQIVFHGF